MYVDAAPFFQSRNVELHALDTGSGKGDFTPFFLDAGFAIHHIGIKNTKNPIMLFIFYLSAFKLIKSEGIDIVHVHRSDLMFTMSIISYFARVGCIYSVHNVFSSGMLTKRWHSFQRSFAQKKLGTTIHSISDAVYDNEHQYYGVNTCKIYNWIDFGRFTPLVGEEKRNLKKKLGLEDHDKIIISIGGCSHIKRHEEIIWAIDCIRREIPSIKYLHLGTGEQEDEEKVLCSELGLEKNVLFLGNQVNVRDYLGISDVYVMTSKFEGISLTTIEAMAMYVPTILYRVPGLSDFNAHGRNISYTIEESKDVLVSTILFVLLNKEVSSVITNDAYNYCRESFSMEKNVEKIFELYTQHVH